jgi:hypothetical protein
MLLAISKKERTKFKSRKQAANATRAYRYCNRLMNTMEFTFAIEHESQPRSHRRQTSPAWPTPRVITRTPANVSELLPEDARRV